MKDKVKIIVITDGDKIACQAVEEAGRQLNLRTISASAGNPTPLTGSEMVETILTAKSEPVLVMVDDCGNPQTGIGERVLEYLGQSPEVEIIGVVAVAANCRAVEGIAVDFSVDQNGQIVDGPVDKEGVPERKGHTLVEGDTVDILNKINVPLIVGIGDIGKMHGRDNSKTGAHVTTRAIQEILNRSGFYEKTAH